MPRNLPSAHRYVLWWTLHLSIVFLAPHKGYSLYNLQQDPFFLAFGQERIWPWKSGEYHPKVFLFIEKGPHGSTLTYSARSYVFRGCPKRFCRKIANFDPISDNFGNLYPEVYLILLILCLISVSALTISGEILCLIRFSVISASF